MPGELVEVGVIELHVVAEALPDQETYYSRSPEQDQEETQNAGSGYAQDKAFIRTDEVFGQ